MSEDKETNNPETEIGSMPNKESAIMDILHQSKLAAMIGSVGPDHFKELELVIEELKIPQVPLPGYMQDFLKGGVPVGQMLCISGPNFATNDDFLRLAHNSMSRSYKTNIMETKALEIISKGGSVVLEHIDISEHFNERIKLSLDNLSTSMLGRQTGKTMMIQAYFKKMHEIVEEELSKLGPCSNPKEFTLTETPDHKSKNYYERKSKVKPKPSSLLLGLVKNPGV